MSYNQLQAIGNLITYPTPLFYIDIDNLCDPNFLIKKILIIKKNNN
jgi:hypothetical protein